MGRCSGRRNVWAFAGVAALATTMALAPAALADTIGDPLGLVRIGTAGSDSGPSGNPWPWLAVSHGGCAKGAVAVAIGDPGRDCGARGNWGPIPGTGDAEGSIAIGLLGADSNGNTVAVSDTGSSDVTCQWYVTDGCVAEVAASGTGPSTARDVSVSGTGSATGSSQYIHNLASVSGTGDASWTLVAVSGMGTADGDLLAVSGTGHAQSSGGVAVSVTGTADD